MSDRLLKSWTRVPLIRDWRNAEPLVLENLPSPPPAVLAQQAVGDVGADLAAEAAQRFALHLTRAYAREGKQAIPIDSDLQQFSLGCCEGRAKRTHPALFETADLARDTLLRRAADLTSRIGYREFNPCLTIDLALALHSRIKVATRRAGPYCRSRAAQAARLRIRRPR